jgi:hypothetical protein
MIIPLPPRPKQRSSRTAKASRPFEVWALTGDFSLFSVLYSSADAPDAPAFFAAELFSAMDNHSDKTVAACELAVWSDILPLDAKRWMFYVTTERLSDKILALLHGLVRGTNGWCPVGRVPTLPESAVPLYEYEKGERNLLLSDVQVGKGEKALAHPMVNCSKTGLSLGFGVFPEGYLNENKLYLGTGGGICFKTKSAQRLRPRKVYCLAPESKGAPPTNEPPAPPVGPRLLENRD